MENQTNNENRGTLSFDEILEDKRYQSEFDKRLSKALETAREKWQKDAEAAAAQTLKQAVKDATDPLNAKVKRLMISAEIGKASAKDPADVLALLDMEKITVNNDAVEGLSDQLTAIKEKKPYLFREDSPAGKTGLSHGAPDPAAEEAKIREIMGLNK